MPTYQIVTGITVQKQLVSLPSRFLDGDPFCEDDGSGDCCEESIVVACCDDAAWPQTIYAIMSSCTGYATHYEGAVIPLHYVGPDPYDHWSSGVISGGVGYCPILLYYQCTGPLAVPQADGSIDGTYGSVTTALDDFECPLPSGWISIVIDSCGLGSSTGTAVVTFTV